MKMSGVMEANSGNQQLSPSSVVAIVISHPSVLSCEIKSRLNLSAPPIVIQGRIISSRRFSFCRRVSNAGVYCIPGVSFLGVLEVGGVLGGGHVDLDLDSSRAVLLRRPVLVA